jgi:hypothetical protein
MPSKTIRYEVSDLSNKHTSTLREAREIAKRWAIRNYNTTDAERYVLIHKFDIPNNPYAGTSLVEKWRVDTHGNLVKKEV